MYPHIYVDISENDEIYIYWSLYQEHNTAG